MRAGKPTIVLGTVVIILGIVFYLQGQSIVGPESSFMYSNPEWITNGQWIIIGGIVMLSTGFALSKINLRRPK
ncbi:MAG TPA: hypothetical protein VLD38_05400 [Nitrosopumilaceae archaeon]|nr:hypothetical protein [Nitrosopumilaceae archaeon]